MAESRPRDTSGGGGDVPVSPGERDDTDFNFKKLALFDKGKKKKEDKPDAAGLGALVTTAADCFAPGLAHPKIRNKSNVDEDQGDEYVFSKTKLGKAFVFVNRNFNEETTNQKMRTGAENDLRYYGEAFKHLGFDVDPVFDGTTEDIWRKVTDYAKNDHSDESCVVFAFSTHGDEELLDKKARGYYGQKPKHSSRFERDVVTDVIYGSDGVIFTKDLIEQLSDKNCPTLRGKPRLFFFQACRGQMLDELLVRDGDDFHLTHFHSNPMRNTVVDVPLKKDFFIAYSAPPGYYSFRRSKAANPDDVGSWFVVALNKAIKEHGFDVDLLELMTLVAGSMANDQKYTSKVPLPEFKGRRIVPYISSMLLKTVRFRRD